MTVMTDLNAIVTTASSKTAMSALAIDVNALVSLAKQHVAELKVVMSQIISVYPSSGGDSANHAALVSVLAELA